MALIRCPKCGKEINNQIKKCPYCGNKTKVRDSFLSLLSIACTICMCTMPLGVLFAIIDLIKSRNTNADQTKTHAGSKLSLIISAIVIALIVIWDNNKGNKNEAISPEETLAKVQQTEMHKSNEEDTTTIKIIEESTKEENTTEESTTEKPTINIDELSELEYKSNCKQIYYEDVKDKSGVSKGDYVKIEAYLQQTFQRDIYESMADELWKKYNLNLIYFEFGILVKQYENNYGGENALLFSNDYDLSASSYKNGDKIIIYGKVVDVKTNGWTGISNIYLIPKYIEKIN